jgi:hypothetical protein
MDEAEGEGWENKDRKTGKGLKYKTHYKNSRLIEAAIFSGTTQHVRMQSSHDRWSVNLANT